MFFQKKSNIFALVFLVLTFFAITTHAQTMTFYGSPNTINDMALHGKYVWCATQGGIVRWDTQTGEHLRLTKEDGLISDRITAIAVDENGVVWTGSDEGLSRYDGSEFSSYTSLGSIEVEEIRALAVDKEGGVWIAANRELVALRNGYWCIYGNHITRDIAVGIDGSIWTAEWYEGVGRFKDEKWTFYSEETSTSINHINTGKDGLVWASGNGSSVYSFDGTEWTKLNAGGILCSDNDYSCWISSGHRLAHYKEDEWTYTLKTLAEMSSIFLDDNGAVWCATDLGLLSYKNETYTLYKVYDAPINDRGTDICFSPDGTMWYATSSGISRYKDGKWTSWDLKYKFTDFTDHSVQSTTLVDVGPNGDVWALKIYKDHNDTLPYSSYLAHFNGANWEFYDVPLDKRSCPNLSADENGGVWAKGATRYGYFDGSSWDVHSTWEILDKELAITDIHYHPANASVWISVKGMIIEMKNGKINTYEMNIDNGQYCSFQSICDELYMSNSYNGTRLYQVENGSLKYLTGVSGCNCPFGVSPDGLIVISDSNDIIYMNVGGELQEIFRPALGDHFGASAIVHNKIDTFWIADYEQGIMALSDLPAPQLASATGKLVEEYKSVIGATVTFSPGNYSTTTAGGGEWKIDGILPGEYVITYEFVSSISQQSITIPTSGNVVRSSRKNHFFLNIENSVDVESQIPYQFSLDTPYPNPFNASVTIPFSLDKSSKTKLTVYDINGQKVRELAESFFSAGLHSVLWNGLDDSGQQVASGLYFVRLSADSRNECQRVMFVK